MTTHRWSDIKSRKGRISPERQQVLDAEAKAELATFKALREQLGLTQGDVARLAEMTQSEVSRFEQRDDHRLSTLRAMVEALGGELEITAVMPDGRRVAFRTLDAMEKQRAAKDWPTEPTNSNSAEPRKRLAR